MQRGNYIYLGIIGLLVLVLILRDCGSRPKPTIDNHYNYTTDTTFSKKQYEAIIGRIKGLEDKLQKTPPKEIIYYPTPNPGNVTLEKIPDSLLVYIKDLENKNDSLRIAISDKYIKNYPKADKLIDFKLASENLDITTLNIAGEIKEGKYPLYLDEYDYYWKENSLFHIKRDNPIRKTDPNTWKQLYINGGYDFLANKPKMGLDYTKTLGRFRVRASGEIYIQDNPTLSADLLLGYRLFR